MMKALTFSIPEANSGTPSRELVDLPVPHVERGGVLVRVHFAGLNYIDLETSRGEHNKAVARALKRSPVASGIEMAGVAETDGERIKKGDRVCGYTQIFKGPFYHAQYVSAPEKNLAVVPESTSLEGATSIIGGALTSINALERIARLNRNHRVLITGATGSVGVTGVQLAAYLNAEVAAVCHSTQCEFALSQGASQAFAYDKSEMPEAQNQFDLVFDTAPSLSFAAAGKFLTPRGRYISTMPHRDVAGFARSLVSMRKWGFLLEYDTDARRMERLRTLIADGAFPPTIDSIYPLEDAAAAFARQERPGKKGKILLDMRGSRELQDA